MNGFLIDTNVFSRIFKGDLKLSAFAECQASYIDTTIYIECIQGSSRIMRKSGSKNI